MDEPEYLLVKTWCRDGDQEYTDSFCVADDYGLNDEHFEKDLNITGIDIEKNMVKASKKNNIKKHWEKIVTSRF